jgi:hypothetical protein
LRLKNFANVIIKSYEKIDLIKMRDNGKLLKILNEIIILH